MKAQYTSTSNTEISIALDAGETLATLAGPTTIVIAANPGLLVYTALIGQGIAIQPAIRTANGRQLRYALNQLAFRKAWDTAVTVQVAAGKQADCDYWTTTSAMSQIPEDNPKIARIAAAAVPPISIKALFDLATTL